jgi:hypothetical protein
MRAMTSDPHVSTNAVRQEHVKKKRKTVEQQADGTVARTGGHGVRGGGGGGGVRRGTATVKFSDSTMWLGSAGDWVHAAVLATARLRLLDPQRSSSQAQASAT